MTSSATSIGTAVPTGTWNVDPAHSSVKFSVKHLGIATVRGEFTEFEGTLEIGNDLASARAYGTVKSASVYTNEENRDADLRSENFLHAELHPDLSFESTAIRPVDADSFEIEGDLTMRGTTRPITLKAEVQGTESDPWGNERVGLEVTGELDRTDWGITFNQVLGSGNLLVSNRVKLTLDISAIKQAE
jgi:polyisoprenoid-binding protein YceI